MKKMLKKCFLFLILACSMSLNLASGGFEVNEEYLRKQADRITRNEKVLSILSANLEEEITDLAYQDIDSIPVKSPISVIEIQRISSDYGMRTHPVHKDRRFHKGIDVVAPVGTEILTTADGVVDRIVESSHGYGNQIIIKHGHNYETRYAHLSEIQVEIGQKVEVGQIIGTLGSSGLTTGPHLHYEIINNNNSIDPMIFSYSDVTDRDKDQYISTLIALETT